MAIRRGDLIEAVDVEDKLKQCLEGIKTNLKNLNYKDTSSKWVNRIFNCESTELIEAYGRHTLDKDKVNGKNSGSKVPGTAPALHTKESVIRNIYTEAVKDYEIVAGMPIKVGELVSCLISCFTASTSLRMALYTIADYYNDPPYNMYRTLTFYKTGLFPSEDNWNNKYIALLSANLGSEYPQHFKEFLFTNRVPIAGAPDRANATIMEGGDIAGLETKIKAYFDYGDGQHGHVAYGQYNLSTITSYHSGLSNREWTIDDGLGYKLKDLVPAMNNFSPSSDTDTTELKRGKVIFAESVNKLFTCVQTLNQHIASGCYCVFSDFDPETGLTTIRYHVDSQYVKDGVTVETVIVNKPRGLRYSMGTMLEIFGNGIIDKFNDKVKKEAGKPEESFNRWEYNQHDTSTVVNGTETASPNTILTMEKRYIDVWLIPNLNAEPYPPIGPGGGGSGGVLSWGRWSTANVYCDQAIHDSLTNQGVLGCPCRWDHLYKLGQYHSLGDDNTEFGSGVLGTRTISPGSGSGTASSMKRWPNRQPAQCSLWADMTLTCNSGYTYFATTLLSCSLNETTHTHRGVAVVLVDANVHNWSNDMSSGGTYVTPLYDYVPQRAKTNSGSTTVFADGVYLVNRYYCHISLNDALHPDYGSDDSRGGSHYTCWAGWREVNPYHSRLNTFLGILKKGGNNRGDSDIIGFRDKEWPETSITDNWGKPMWFKIVNQKVRIKVYLVRVNSEKMPGFEQSWGECCKGYFLNINPDNANDRRMLTGEYGRFPEQMRVKNSNNEWVRPSLYQAW